MQQYESLASVARCLFELWRADGMDKNIKMGFPRSEALRFAKAVHAGHTKVEEFVEQN